MATSNALVRLEDTLRSPSVVERIEALTPSMTPAYVREVVLLAARKNPVILQCTPISILACVLNASKMDLAVDVGGQSYLVPFKDRKTGNYNCQLIIGYPGLIKLACESGIVQNVESVAVYQGDFFEYERGTQQKLTHVPSADQGDLTHVYALARFSAGGEPQFDVMTKKEIDGIRARSKAKHKGPWVTDYGEMARKTVARRLCKYLPRSIRLNTALEFENRAESGTNYPVTEIDVALMEELPEPVEEPLSDADLWKRIFRNALAENEMSLEDYDSLAPDDRKALDAEVEERFQAEKALEAKHAGPDGADSS